METIVATVLAELDRLGLLLQSDGRFPSVAGLVVGAPVTGSWWGHPRGKEIYAVAVEVGEHADVLTVKLVDGKLTLVHRRHWADLLAIARAGAPWQLAGLTPLARDLHGRVVKAGELHPDPPKKRSAVDPKRKEAIQQLESRLLVYSSSVHTPSGAHARSLESWDHLMKRLKLPAAPRAVADAQKALEKAAAGLAPGQPPPPLPWPR